MTDHWKTTGLKTNNHCVTFQFNKLFTRKGGYTPTFFFTTFHNIHNIPLALDQVERIYGFFPRAPSSYFDRFSFKVEILRLNSCLKFAYWNTRKNECFTKLPCPPAPPTHKFIATRTILPLNSPQTEIERAKNVPRTSEHSNLKPPSTIIDPVVTI